MHYELTPYYFHNMKKFYLTSLLLLQALLLLAAPVIDMAGEWDFRIDRENKGEQEGWFNDSFRFQESVTLPGSMPQRMKGDDISTKTQWIGALYDSSYFHNPFMAPYRKSGKDMKLPFFLTPSKHYVGKAWYKRTVVIPSDGTTHYRLFLERPHIATTVWVNGRKIKAADKAASAYEYSRNSLSVPHVYDLGDALRAGTNTIAICVDNDPKVANVGNDSHSVTDQTQGDWNGIVGRIELQACSPIAGIRVFPDIDRRTATVKLTMADIPVGQTVTIEICAESFNTAKRHIIANNPVKVKGGTKEVELTLNMGDEMLLWDEFCPQMYRLNVETKSKCGECHDETYFGMRKVEVRGRDIFVNNRLTQLRGTVENCCFPNTGYPPTDLDSWMKVFEKCKQWGLNHVRFHSYCPPEAAFLAADLVGIYIQPEGPSWPNHGVKLGRGEYIDKYLIDESIRITDEYGNHPSFCLFAFGNEPAGNWVRWCNDNMKVMQQHDARHIYCGFSVGGGWAWQPYTEAVVKAGARGLNSWGKSAPESTADFADNISTYNGKDMPGTPITKPFISHETGQWCAFPRLADTVSYKGVNKAHNFEIFNDLMKANGMAGRTELFTQASGKLQTLCYKYEIERHLRTPHYAGFQLLALNDYSGQGTAIVGLTDVFFNEKGYVTAPEFREFCSKIVPLAKIAKFTYTNTETFKADIELSQFSGEDIPAVAPHWTITHSSSANPTVFAEGDLPKCALPIGQNIELGSISVPLTAIEQAGKYTLTVTIPGTEAKNHWDFWVYPSDLCMASKLKKAKREGAVYADGILVTDTLDKEAVKVLRKGGRVLLLAAGKVTYGREVKQTFTPVFWNTSWFKMRPPHTTGICVENSHPLFKDFPTDFHSDLQWWELVNKASVMQFTDFPADFQPLVQSIDTWFVSRKIGMLFEASIGKGRLVMTTMDLKNDLDKRHVAKQMRYSILKYMQSADFHPQWSLPLERITDLFTNVAGEVNMFTNDSPDELKPKLK